MTALTGHRRKAPYITVFTIVLICLLGFIYLWSSTGGTVPGLADPYRITFRADDIKNLRPAGDVRVAGVLVGRVVGQEIDGDKAAVQLEIDDDFAPLHEGATVRVGMKSVIGQSYVAVVDGEGPEMPPGTVLEGDAVTDPVDLDEVISTFDQPTKAALRGLLSSLDPTAANSRQSVSQLLEGAGMIGREGYTAVDAIAAQGQDLKALVNEANQILAALNTGRDQIGSLVVNAQAITNATAGQSDELARSVRGLPGLVTAAGRATATLDGLARDLSPVARDLNAAAPGLSAALRDLPPVTRGLRTLLDPMNSSLGRADQTLDQVPELSRQLSGIAPDLETTLRNVNPMVEYLVPYGTDIGSFFGNFGGSFNVPLENGVKAVRLAPIFSEYSVRNIPLDLQLLNPLHWNNPYPKPMQADDPARFRGQYPRILADE